MTAGPTPAEEESGRLDEPRRTDPRTFAVTAIDYLVRLAIPIGIASFAIFRDGEALGVLLFLPIAMLFIGMNFLFAWLAWRRLTYSTGETDIRVESGVVSRAARSVPYDRIQDVSLEQALVPRLFGLVKVAFETGAGGKDDLKLAYLTEAEGERLRELVRARKDGGAPQEAPSADGVPEQGGDLLFAMGPRRVVTFGLFEFSLVVVAAVGGFVGQFDFLLPFDVWEFEQWQAQFAGPGAWLSGLGFAAQVIGGMVLALMLLAVGFATGLARTILREWGFRLEKTAKGLRRRRGLLTRTDVVMPVHRVQALAIGTRIVRRPFGWHGLNVISLAQDSGGANHPVAPFAQMEEIERVIAATGFAAPDADLDWRRGSAKHRVDSALIAFSITLPIALAAGLTLSRIPEAPVGAWIAVLPALAGVVLAGREAFLWRFDRNAIDGVQIYSRHGWLAPRLTIGAREKLQSVEIAQGPIARWRGYATLHLGLAGGSFSIEGVPLERARKLRRAVLKSIAQRDFSAVIAE
ncbi:MAG: PH domain-containing protein [Qipengyuania sp.]